MNATFDVVFAVFVVAMLAVVVLAVRWAVRRDRAARAEQAARREAGEGRDPGGAAR